MPSKNPRISVVLTPALASTLSALSEVTGDSAASIVRSLLDQAHPALDRMLQLVTAAAKAKGQLGAGIGATLDRVVDDLEDAMALADARTARVVRDLVSEAEGVRGRRRRLGGVAAQPAAAAPPTPAPVTRGSGSPEGGVSKARRVGRVRAV